MCINNALFYNNQYSINKTVTITILFKKIRSENNSFKPEKRAVFTKVKLL